MIRNSRREFMQSAALGAAAVSAETAASAVSQTRSRLGYSPGRIPNEYDLFLPGERAALAESVSVGNIDGRRLEARLGSQSKTLQAGEEIGGWKLLTIVSMNGTATAVFEKHVTHNDAIIYVTESEGLIARIPKGVGDLSKVRPRPVNAPEVKLTRGTHYIPGPDFGGNYVLNSNEDPCYENVAALGKEYIGWSLVANQEAGPSKSLYIAEDGSSRQLPNLPEGQATWAPDLAGSLFNPRNLLPDDIPQIFEYVPGYCKRTLLGGYLPVADTGVWNPHYHAGYEVIVLLPPGPDAEPMARLRAILPDGKQLERYWHASAGSFFAALAGIWNPWYNFIEAQMPVEIPDRWLLNLGRAGIVLSRSSYRGLEPTYQVGEGAYTKIPE